MNWNHTIKKEVCELGLATGHSDSKTALDVHWSLNDDLIGLKTISVKDTYSQCQLYLWSFRNMLFICSGELILQRSCQLGLGWS